MERPRLSGDWGGWRETLAEHGIVPRASYLAGFWSNLRGGFEAGTRYEGFAKWSVEADLETLARWKGGSFEINWYSYHGGQPSRDLVGLFASQTLSGNETSVAVRFYEIYLEQSFRDGRLVLKGGQIAADDDFFASDKADALLNASFGFLGLGRALEIAPIYPLAVPGLHLRATSEDRRWELQLGAYSGDPGEDVPGNFGFDHAIENGAFLLGEIRVRPSPFGLPGGYAVGVAATTAKLLNFESGGSASGTYGLFAVMDQLLVEQSAGRPGLGVFAKTYGAPEEDRNLVSWYFDIGLKLTRPFPGRGEDLFAVGFAHLNFSGDYVDWARDQGEGVSRSQSILELTYRFQATGWLTLQPDLQFIFDPHFSRTDAIAIGLRAVIEL